MGADERIPSTGAGEPIEPGDPREVEEAVAACLDRLNAGEKLDPLDVFAAHPTIAEEVLDRIYAFIGLTGDGGAPSPGMTIGDYTVRRTLGRGGMGVVYEAWENSMDRPVALKVLPQAVAADGKTFLRFMREARTAGQLSHPNVVPVFAMGMST